VPERSPTADRMTTLEQENERLTEALELYRILGDFESSGFDLDELIERFLKRTMQVLRTSAGTLFSIEPGSGDLIFRVVRGKARSKLTGLRLPRGAGIAGWVAQTGKPRLARNVRSDRRWWRELSEFIEYPTKDILAVPLRARSGKLVGVVELLNKDDHSGFTQADLQFLVNLSGTVGTLLENARLWSISQRRNLQLRLLNEVGQLINSSLEPEVVQRRTIRAANQLVGAAAGSLLLRDEASGELFFQVVLGSQADQVKRQRLKPGEGIAGWVVSNGQPLVIDDCEHDPRWSARVDRASRFRTRNMICVPVTHKDRVIGALQAVNKRSGDFDADDLEMMQALADRVASALENARLFDQLQRTLVETSKALAESIEVRDAYTGGHTRRVVDLSLAIARQMKLDEKVLEQLRLAAILHDIGKIGVDDLVLRKPGRLDEAEFQQMKRHPSLGVEILGHIHYFDQVLPGIRSHHERHDGRGYPDGLGKRAIPLIAKVIAVADTYDAMTSDRPYRKGLDQRIALDEIRVCSGSQFDPKVVAAFLRAYRAGAITGKKERLPARTRKRSRSGTRPAPSGGGSAWRGR
jgi:putative nucleotidyltransferase with HDIG domain